MDIITYISRYGLSEECKELIPNIAPKYLKGKSLQELRRKFKGDDKRYAKEIYTRLDDTIKDLSLRKIAPLYGLHPEDLKLDILYVDTILRYCFQLSQKKQKLEKKFLDSIETSDKRKDKNMKAFIKRKYKDGKNDINDFKNIRRLNNQSFNLFVLENIILNNIE